MRDDDAAAVRYVQGRVGGKLPPGDDGVEPGEIDAGIDRARNGTLVVDDGIGNPEQLVVGHCPDAVGADGELATGDDTIEKLAVGHDRPRPCRPAARAEDGPVEGHHRHMIIFEVAVRGRREYGAGAGIPAVGRRQLGEGRENLVRAFENAIDAEGCRLGELLRVAAHLHDAIRA